MFEKNCENLIKIHSLLVKRDFYNTIKWNIGTRKRVTRVSQKNHSRGIYKCNSPIVWM